MSTLMAREGRTQSRKNLDYKPSRNRPNTSLVRLYASWWPQRVITWATCRDINSLWTGSQVGYRAKTKIEPPYRAIFLFALHPTWEPVHRPDINNIMGFHNVCFYGGVFFCGFLAWIINDIRMFKGFTGCGKPNNFFEGSLEHIRWRFVLIFNNNLFRKNVSGDFQTPRSW